MNINLLNTDEVAKLRNLISTSHKAVLFCHVNADGDALGSTLTWSAYLRQQGMETTVVAPDMFPDFLQWMPGAQDIVRYDKKPEVVKKCVDEADIIFMLDLNAYSRTGDELASILYTCKGNEKKVVIIDHHLNPQGDTDMTISYPLMSSTCEIVFRLIWQLGGYEEMTKEMAITTYTGMMTDTGGFTYNSTQPEIYYIISQLLAKGIDKDRIYRNVFHVFSIDRLRLTGYVLYQKLRILTPLRASYYTITKEEQKRFHFIKGDAEGLVNMPLQIKKHRLSISLREDSERPNLIWVSLRSVDDFPCNKMAEEYFNGGGHKNASGGRLYCRLQEAEAITRKAIQAYADLL